MLQLNLLIKRVFDILFSFSAIIILIPLWIVTGIAIKMDSKGPILFKQGRRTKDGRIFNMWKYRSMVVNAENMGAGLFNYENDPRVTKVGFFLRKYSIDELPQLLNILKGEMSIVGPRPCVSYELGDYKTLNQRFKKRFEVTAGITGLAQIQGRNELPWDVKADLDAKYICLFKKWGVLIDIAIIIKTIFNVFAKVNIYEQKITSDVDDTISAKLTNEEIIRKAHE